MKDVKRSQKRMKIEQIIALGNKQLELCNLDEASQSFHQILEIDPDNETAKMVLDYIGVKVRKEEIAQLLNQGWKMLMMDQQYDDFIRIAEQILGMDPQNTEARSLITTARKALTE